MMCRRDEAKGAAMGPKRREHRSHLSLLRRGAAVGLSLTLCMVLAQPLAAPDRLRDAVAAFGAGNYKAAEQIFSELAYLGNAEAQAYLGRMYEKGLGVPQNYMVAAAWYRCSSGQGFPPAAYALGLLYDKGQGVPQDYVLAYTWLNRAVAGAGPGRERYYWTNIRDAIASKLSLVQKLLAQEMALIGPEPHVCPPLGEGVLPDPLDP
jgi:hypothetical protein